MSESKKTNQIVVAGVVAVFALSMLLIALNGIFPDTVGVYSKKVLEKATVFADTFSLETDRRTESLVETLKQN